LVDTDYGGVHLPPLFLEVVVKRFVLVFASFGD
jgi:hypothetical protein